MMSTILEKANPNIIMTVSFIIFLLNMVCVWYAHFSSLHYIQGTFLDHSDKVSQTHLLAKGLDGSEANSIALAGRMIEAEIHLKSIANKQSMVTVSIGMAFGLMAIGCGLFILGVQGGLDAELKSPQGGSVVWKSSVPGTLCFALGALIIIIALRDPARINFGTFRLERTGTVSQPASSIDSKNNVHEVDYDSEIYGTIHESTVSKESDPPNGTPKINVGDSDPGVIDDGRTSSGPAEGS